VCAGRLLPRTESLRWEVFPASFPASGILGQPPSTTPTPPTPPPTTHPPTHPLQHPQYRTTKNLKSMEFYGSRVGPPFSNVLLIFTLFWGVAKMITPANVFNVAGSVFMW
jgi:hypothetical protein